jgi:hypothetical protein
LTVGASEGLSLVIAYYRKYVQFFILIIYIIPMSRGKNLLIILEEKKQNRKTDRKINTFR